MLFDIASRRRTGKGMYPVPNNRRIRTTNIDFIFTTFVIYLNTAEILISIRTEQNMYLLFN